MAYHTLDHLQGHSGHGAFSGGSYATPPFQSQTAMSMFAPGTQIQAPSTPILDAFSGKLKTRYEVPDTAQTVNLGEIVVFTNVTNGENFMTNIIYPLIETGEAIKTFSWDIWKFPQFPVRPTPETAPPRFLASTRLSDSTNLMRFSIGQHMSSEYGKTPRGRANQRYNLEQMAGSCQETLNLMGYNEIKRSQHHHRALLEKFGEYKPIDVEKAMLKEVSQFCRPQKIERGFQILWEEVAEDMRNEGGKANSAILTTKVHSLVLAQPELTEFYRAGPKGPETVANPNRTFLPNGVAAYHCKFYPERAGLDTHPWQNIAQIGGYHKSLELSTQKSNREDYLKYYNSLVRGLSIYDQETDSKHFIDVSELINHAYIWRDDGSLDGAFEPMHGGRGNTVLDMETEEQYRDFITFTPREVLEFQPLSIEQSLNDDVVRNQHRTNNMTQLTSNLHLLPKSLEIFGQLAPQHFGWENIRDTGGMIIHRLSDAARIDVSEFRRRISNGLQLYRDMCKREPDLDFLTFAIKNHIRDLYRRNHATLTRTVPTTPQHLPPSMQILWVDASALTQDVLDANIRNAVLETDSTLNVAKLRGVGGGLDHLPLPLGTNDDFPETTGRIFRNLTGFASYNGFKSMAEAYRSGNAVLSSRYNLDDLKCAAEFIDIMENMSNHLMSILPQCQCFQEIVTGNKTGGQILCEQFFNMVGLPLWINLKKVNNFIVNTAGFDTIELSQGVAGKFRGSHLYLGYNTANTKLKADAQKYLEKTGVFYTEVIHASLKRYYSSETLRGESIFTVLYRAVKQKLKNMKNFATSIGLAQTASGLTFADTYNITSADDILYLVKQWIEPTIARPIFDGTTNVALDHTGVIAGDGSNTGNHAALLGNAPPGNMNTVEAIYGASNAVEWLSLSTPVVSQNCIAAFSYTRLNLYGMIMQALIMSTKLDDVSFLTAFIKLNLLIMPYTGPSINLNGHSSVNKGCTVAENGAATMDYIIRQTDYATLFAHEIHAKNARNARYTPPAVAAGINQLDQLSFIFMAMLKEIFTDEVSLARIEEFEKMLRESKLKDVIVETTLHTAVSAGGDLHITLPFLEGILEGDEATIHVTQANPLPLPTLMHTLIVSPNTNALGRTLGLKFNDLPEDVGIASQAMIGGRYGSVLRGEYETGGMGNIGELPAHESFVLTSLTVSADQLTRLFTNNAPSVNKQRFDVRVGQPYNPNGYVNIDAQPSFLALVDRKNQEHKKAVKNSLGRFTGIKSHVADWIDVPLKYIANRSNITFFGPKFGNRGTSVALENIAGVKMSSYYTKSFIQNCQDLDEANVADMEKALAICWMATSFTRESCQTLASKNIRIPMNFLVVRPHANYLMEGCAILSPGIDDLGCTLMAKKDYTYSFSGLTKEMWGHLSFWSGIVTTHPENCRLIRNLMCVGYGPGGGVGWFDPRTYNPLKLGQHKTPAPGSPSLMCLAIPFTENITRPYIVTSGRLQHVDDGHGSSDSIIKSQADMKPHFSTYMRYNQIWKWRDPQDSGIMDTLGDNGQTPLFNKVCWAGTTFYHHYKTGKLTYYTPNKGHWGPNEGHGCQSIRQGAVEKLKEKDYDKRYEDVS